MPKTDYSIHGFTVKMGFAFGISNVVILSTTT